MRELLEAIQTTFNASADLTARFPTGCYHGLAPDGAALPVCTVTISNVNNGFTTCRDYEAVYAVRFNVWALTDTEVLGAVEELEAAFDFADLTMANDACLLVQRDAEEVDREDERVWRGVVQYTVSVERSY